MQVEDARRVASTLIADIVRLRMMGSAKSGNYGHAGRKGHVGGSGPKSDLTPEQKASLKAVASNAVIYHGTTDEAWKAIQKEGLVPHKGVGADILANAPSFVASDGDRKFSVYLTDNITTAETFSRFVAAGHQAHPVILEVRMPQAFWNAHIKDDEQLFGGKRFVGDRIPPQYIRLSSQHGTGHGGLTQTFNPNLNPVLYASSRMKVLYAVFACTQVAHRQSVHTGDRRLLGSGVAPALDTGGSFLYRLAMRMSAALPPQKRMHAAADKFEPQFRAHVMNAFNAGRRAVPDHVLKAVLVLDHQTLETFMDRAVVAMRTTLAKGLPDMLLRVMKAGGDAGLKTLQAKRRLVAAGSAKSGNYGHAGRKGHVGGSAPGSGDTAKAIGRVRKQLTPLLAERSREAKNVKIDDHPVAVQAAQVAVPLLSEMQAKGYTMPDHLYFGVEDGMRTGYGYGPRGATDHVLMAGSTSEDMTLRVLFPNTIPRTANVDDVVREAFVNSRHDPLAIGTTVSSCRDMVLHEMGHVNDHDFFKSFEDERVSKAFPEGGTRRIARSVSSYAGTNANEFVAEAFAKQYRGEHISDDAKRLYQVLNGPAIR